MKKATLLTLPCLFAALLTPVLCCGEDFLLYTPKPAEGGPAPATPDKGILVKSVTIKEGDTLANLSRKYLGRGSWFPQVLLFNSIKNPDLIITGDKLLVPVAAEKAAAPGKKAHAARKHSKVEKRHTTRRRSAARRPSVSRPEAVQSMIPAKTPDLKAAKPVAVRPERIPVRPATPDELGSFRLAKQAYLSGEYARSLQLFTAFLRKYPNSPSSADAALYRADSLLRLSGE
jgi:LysM repeat protein